MHICRKIIKKEKKRKEKLDRSHLITHLVIHSKFSATLSKPEYCFRIESNSFAERLTLIIFEVKFSFDSKMNLKRDCRILLVL